MMACLAAALLGAAGVAQAQRMSALAGVVRDLNGLAIPNATLSVDGRTLQAVSNDSGHFFLGGIPSGRNAFTLAKLGYAVVRFEIDLQPDTTLTVNIPMRPVQNLPGVQVAGERLSARLLQMGFYDRKKVGLGTFLDGDRIERMAYAQQPSSFLRDVRGITVRCRAGGRCTVTASRGCLAVAINKVWVRGQLDDNISAGEVYAIEVYERAAIVPIDFSLPRWASGCGVIAVWTRTFAEPGR